MGRQEPEQEGDCDTEDGLAEAFSEARRGLRRIGAEQQQKP